MHLKDDRGQALTEALIVIPLLTLLAAGSIQFWLFLSAKTTFEHACGIAARSYVAGKLPPSHITDQIWNSLSSSQSLFDRASLVVVQNPSASFASNAFLRQASALGSFFETIKNMFLNYTNSNWTISIRYHSLPIFGSIFPQGIWMQTQLSFIKYPAQE